MVRVTLIGHQRWCFFLECYFFFLLQQQKAERPCWNWDRLCSPLIHPGNQVGQTWLTISKSMLTTPDQLHVLHMDRDGLQNEVLYCLCSDLGGADWPVVPWVLLAVLEDQGDISILPVLRLLCSSHLHDISKISVSGLAMVTTSFLGTHVCIPQGPWLCWCQVCLDVL